MNGRSFILLAVILHHFSNASNLISLIILFRLLNYPDNIHC